jgi:hypothetical protein
MSDTAPRLHFLLRTAAAHGLRDRAIDFFHAACGLAIRRSQIAMPA